MQIELTAAAKNKLDKLSEFHGMTQKAMLGRLVQFFAMRDSRIQSLMIGYYSDDIKADTPRMIFKSIADGSGREE